MSRNPGSNRFDISSVKHTSVGEKSELTHTSGSVRQHHSELQTVSHTGLKRAEAYAEKPVKELCREAAM